MNNNSNVDVAVDNPDTMAKKADEDTYATTVGSHIDTEAQSSPASGADTRDHRQPFEFSRGGAFGIGLVYTLHPINLLIMLGLAAITFAAHFCFLQWGVKPLRTQTELSDNSDAVVQWVIYAIDLGITLVFSPIAILLIIRKTYSSMSRRKNLPTADEDTKGCGGFFKSLFFLYIYMFMAFVVYVVGFALLIIPGILAAIYFSAGNQAVVIDGANPCTAFSKSVKYVKNQFCGTFLYYLGVFIVVLILVLPFPIVMGFYVPSGQTQTCEVLMQNYKNYTDSIKDNHYPACWGMLAAQGVLVALSTIYGTVAATTHFCYLKAYSIRNRLY
eukprot:comp17786_c1_seq1/m.17835 comp17786_c1_seq1/g.17835  ORF comp17786_c1_seq1/g.17835 comp17786_c1_seq1/m.17835 type:complete len:329 (-) comp17786_c1_seq1:432-1418(-)